MSDPRTAREHWSEPEALARLVAESDRLRDLLMLDRDRYDALVKMTGMSRELIHHLLKQAGTRG